MKLPKKVKESLQPKGKMKLPKRKTSSKKSPKSDIPTYPLEVIEKAAQVEVVEEIEAPTITPPSMRKKEIAAVEEAESSINELMAGIGLSYEERETVEITAHPSGHSQIEGETKQQHEETNLIPIGGKEEIVPAEILEGDPTRFMPQDTDQANDLKCFDKMNEANSEALQGKQEIRKLEEDDFDSPLNQSFTEMIPAKKRKGYSIEYKAMIIMFLKTSVRDYNGRLVPQFSRVARLYGIHERTAMKWYRDQAAIISASRAVIPAQMEVIKAKVASTTLKAIDIMAARLETEKDRVSIKDITNAMDKLINKTLILTGQATSHTKSTHVFKAAKVVRPDGT